MNAKANTTTGPVSPASFKIGERVEIVSADCSDKQRDTIGKAGMVVNNCDYLLVVVELDDGRLVSYLPRRLRKIAPNDAEVAASASHDEFTAAPFADVFVIEIRDGSSIYLAANGDINVTGNVKMDGAINQEATAPAALPLSVGMQVMITSPVWTGTGKNPVGLFGMIKREGPLIGRCGNTFDFVVHLTDGRDVLAKASEVSPIVGASEVQSDHPLNLMEQLTKLRSEEKRLMANLTEIRITQQAAEIRAASLRVCGDNVREERKVIVRKCEELEFELTQSIQRAA
jgi:hypothetical protein